VKGKFALEKPLLEVISLFLKLGVTSFGGPAAHIALMHEETVNRKKWINDEEFLDLLGATNLIPGPNSTEMAIHLSYKRAGWKGLIFGGISFILPAVLIVIFLASLYLKYQTLPQMGQLLYGIKPVIIAIIVQALWFLSKKAIKNKLDLLIIIPVILCNFLGINELILLIFGGLLMMFVKNIKQFQSFTSAVIFLPMGIQKIVNQSLDKVDLTTLFLIFLKIGSILYGSGYVLLAFLRSDFVTRLGWLTDTQLMDAIAIGQITPGPVFTTATFIGYLLGDTQGAILATIGIFLPSFIFVALTNPIIPKMRNSKIISGLLDGLNAVSIGLMAAVTWQLGRNALIDIFTIILAIVTLFFLVKRKINPSYLIFAGGILGFLFQIFQ